MLFWFAGFIAFAIFMSDQGICRGTVCMSARAGVAFASFEWYVFPFPSISLFSSLFFTLGTPKKGSLKKREKKRENSCSMTLIDVL